MKVAEKTPRSVRANLVGSATSGSHEIGITITRSTASQNGRPPVTGLFAGLDVVASAIVRPIPLAITIQVPNRSRKRFTTTTGPAIASAVHAIATSTSQNRNASTPKSPIESALASRPIAQNSTEVHPTSCITFNADGRYE